MKRLHSIAQLLRAHGVSCYQVGDAVVAFGEFVVAGSGAQLPPWGFEVVLVRTFKEARAFLCY